MNEIYYPTKQTNKAENFQSFLMTDDLTIQRTRFMIHKAKRLGKIFENEWKELLSKNLYSELPERMRIQKMLSDRQENHTAKIKERVKNHLKELKPVFKESLFLSCSFVSFWLVAILLRSAKL